MSSVATIVVSSSEESILYAASISAAEMGTFEGVTFPEPDLDTLDEYHIRYDLTKWTSLGLDKFIGCAVMLSGDIPPLEGTVDILLPYNWCEFFKKDLITIADINDIALKVNDEQINSV